MLCGRVGRLRSCSLRRFPCVPRCHSSPTLACSSTHCSRCSPSSDAHPCRSPPLPATLTILPFATSLSTLFHPFRFISYSLYIHLFIPFYFPLTFSPCPFVSIKLPPSIRESPANPRCNAENHASTSPDGRSAVPNLYHHLHFEHLPPPFRFAQLLALIFSLLSCWLPSPLCYPFEGKKAPIASEGALVWELRHNPLRH